jgi:2'-5' RNA ligase
MRLFIATTFPDAELRSVNDRVSKVKSKLPPATWVRPAAQHLTFAFLGEQDEQLIDPLSALLTDELADVERFEGRFRDCGFFPNPRHARVGWVGVTPQERFRAVAAAVRSAVKSARIELDGGEFKPHLTLMRIRDVWPPACIEIFHSALRSFESEPFPIEQVTLFSSDLQPGGAVHTPLRRFSLA